MSRTDVARHVKLEIRRRMLGVAGVCSVVGYAQARWRILRSCPLDNLPSIIGRTTRI
jgi:hypothetical protein